MASLKKPVECPCGGTEFSHKYKPERWECMECERVLAQRPQLISGICRDCGASEDDKKFKKGKNLCQECANNYAVKWREKNPGWNKDPEFKRRRFAAVRKAKQKSPEAFLKSLFGYITRPSRKRGKRDSMHIGPKRLAILNDVQIDLDFLIKMYYSQGGCCAITGLQMEHRLGSLCAISIDRVDSGVGYVPGNVQLVCQWVNKAKGSHDNEEFKRVLSAYVTHEVEYHL